MNYSIEWKFLSWLIHQNLISTFNDIKNYKYSFKKGPIRFCHFQVKRKSLKFPLQLMVWAKNCQVLNGGWGAPLMPFFNYKFNLIGPLKTWMIKIYGWKVINKDSQKITL